MIRPLEPSPSGPNQTVEQPHLHNAVTFNEPTDATRSAETEAVEATSIARAMIAAS